jgi:hypothetical protein
VLVQGSSVAARPFGLIGQATLPIFASSVLSMLFGGSATGSVHEAEFDAMTGDVDAFTRFSGLIGVETRFDGKLNALTRFSGAALAETRFAGEVDADVRFDGEIDAYPE